MNPFNRRSRSASASRPQNNNASASAHVAATQAFLASRASQANLSSSAAAAALRALTPPPTQVSQVQTKRMVQKRASMSSVTGSARGRPAALQRQGSSSSMTERTFRTPSPSPSRAASRPEPNVHPPVPALPHSYANSPTAAPKPKPSKQRVPSQDAPAPRPSSPPAARPNKQGQSSDPFGTQPQPQQQRQTPAAVRRPDLAVPNELERTDSRNSVNFSRPLSPRPQSPVPQSPVANPFMLTNGDRFPPNIVASISPAQADDIQYGLTQVANQPVKKKKKKVASHAAEGSHLHDGTMASRPVVTPLESGPLHMEHSLPRDQQQPVPKKKKKKKKAAVTGEASHFSTTDYSDYTEQTDFGPRPDSDSDSNTERTKEKRAQRASGVLQKQPSIVKEDWEGEQQEQVTPTLGQNDVASAQGSTQIATSSNPPTTRSLTAANVSRKMGEPTPVPKSRAQPAVADYNAFTTAEQSDSSVASSNNLQVQAPQSARGSSLSPSRSTRFSESLSSDLAAGRKHDPLPRSVSPAKSALKHHSPAPSGSPLDPSFNRPRGASATPSETSDISTTEAETLPKHKKSARVSFDAAPEVVGEPASGEAFESPSKEKKSWLGLGKSKPTLSTIPSNDDMEELMKPRPQLPSFGSVRGQNLRGGNDLSSGQRAVSSENRPQYSNDAKATASSIASSETSSSSLNNPTPTGVSNDHLVGAIFAQEAQRTSQPKSGPNDPLPPEVTSVEGGVSFSDSESATSDEDDEIVKAAPAAEGIVVRDAPAPKPPTLFVTSAPAASPPTALPSQTEVPLLSVSPPTPALEGNKPNDQWLVEVPGGFPVSSDALAQLNESNKARTGTGELAATSNGLGVNVPSESESDNDSIYSDAAEDPSELDGTGFGSIDAIVDSPVIVAPSPRLATVPESPLARVTERRFPEPDPHSPSWEETQARWSNIAEQTKQSPLATPPAAQQLGQQQPQVPATQTTLTQPIVGAQPQQTQQKKPTQPSQSRKKKKQSPLPDTVAAAPVSAAFMAARGVVPESPLRQKNQPSAYPAIQQQRIDSSPPAQQFRQSMRTTSPPAPEPSFKQSLRGENRHSMPNPAANQPKQKRFSQPPPPTIPAVQAQVAVKPATQPRAALQKKHIPPQAAPTTGIPAQKQRPPPPPIPTNDSDSESSFRKARRSKSASGGKYTMRRSMRGSADSSLADPRNGVRSVSPLGRRPFSPPAGPHSMRTSMRGAMDNTPTLRGSTDTKRSSSLFGRRQTSRPPAAPAVSSTGFESKTKSRIVDSDDEDNSPRPTKWRSRFADDSDDDPEFTPVRGIPRRANNDDSTDLEDSSDEEKAPVRAAPKLVVATNNTTTPGGVPEPPASPQKRGLFGRFRSKRPKEETPSPVIDFPQPAPKQEKTKASQLGFSSTAERDKMIEQTRARLEAAQNVQAAASPPPSSHGKLQRRHIPQRVMSDSWPLPPKIPDHMNNRPGTAESAPVRNGSTRLAEGSMRGYHDSPAVGKSGKKKRFPMLRKAFGLKD
ncbi:uncharacterized protein A1O9_02873 [Exophiala aquamarina CBS 119918]|uniref:Uncharacterized protein n=1 Tax=Exophiala aquamarina CBS 119918 TaxID=1182545 RepID=A0A072PPR7_9EURO|nr:uncharacterized protein A1O9_02873 [Exophiala aquamarina CBS 119918]KEF61308.1 hypothetical protein A1O9_02873 [Exophiala aquamarina CBS 119918]